MTTPFDLNFDAYLTSSERQLAILVENAEHVDQPGYTTLQFVYDLARSSRACWRRQTARCTTRKQHRRLAKLIDEVDELIDTLSWTVEARHELMALIDAELRG